MINTSNDFQSLINSKVVSISNEDGHTILTFDNGDIVKLNGSPQTINTELSVRKCIFCGAPQDNYPMFTLNDETDKDNIYMCKDCVSKAFNTFIKNGIEMPLNSVDLKKLMNNECK